MSVKLRANCFVLVIKIIVSFYKAFFTPEGRPKALDIITPGHCALYHSLNHLSSLGSIQPCATNMHYSALTGIHLPLKLMVLLKDTSVTTSIQIQHSDDQTPELQAQFEFGTPKRSTPHG